MDPTIAATGDALAANARILLADDSPLERAALALYLRTIGYEVSEAGHGKDAIEHIKANPVDALLLDLAMPIADGFDVLTYLQEHHRSLPVILLSGMPVEQIQREIHGLPQHELPPLLFKPIDIDQLLQLLELQLSGGIPKSTDDSDKMEAAQ
jgi:CheY-like chemotaxis protein